MAEESGCKIGDLPPIAELVDCTPAAPEVLSVDVSAVPLEASPVQKAAAATIEQTGADPPPQEIR